MHQTHNMCKKNVSKPASHGATDLQTETQLQSGWNWEQEPDAANVSVQQLRTCSPRDTKGHLQSSSTITNEKMKTEAKWEGKTGHYLEHLFSDSALTVSHRVWKMLWYKV